MIVNIYTIKKNITSEANTVSLQVNLHCNMHRHDHTFFIDLDLFFSIIYIT